MAPFFSFYFRVALLKQNSSHKGTLIIERLLGNLVQFRHEGSWSEIEILGGVKGSDCRETEPTDCADYQKLHQGNSFEKPQIG